MPNPANRAQVLEHEFPEIRARLLQLAASLDRIDRAAGNIDSDPRPALIRRGMEMLLGGAGDRAEHVQLIFSRPYEDGWRTRFELAANR